MTDDSVFYSILPSRLPDTGYLFETYWTPTEEEVWSWTYMDVGERTDFRDGFSSKAAALTSAAKDWEQSGGEPRSRIAATLKGVASRLERNDR